MRSIVDDCLKQLGRALEIYPWADKLAYGDWLAQTYYYVRHSTRLLATASGRFQHDPTGDAMHHRYAKHIGEEQKHEKLCLHDLEALGLELAALPERTSTRMFWEPQYYKVEHENPALLMGYILALEAMSAVKGPWVLAQVRAAHGDRAASFLALHAEEDIDHVAKAYKAIEGLDPVVRTQIAQNIVQSTDAYTRLLAECASAASSSGLRAPALVEDQGGCVLDVR
jgi:pyrroloquinoline quinone (PQQ) biosynthesis protein C